MEFHDWAMVLDPGTDMAGPIIIAIDEVQSFTAAVDTPLAKPLQGLHDQNQHIGPGLPLTLVLVGLGDTAANAETLGLTRTEHAHEISALSASEVSSLMTGFAIISVWTPPGGTRCRWYNWQNPAKAGRAIFTLPCWRLVLLLWSRMESLIM